VSIHGHHQLLVLVIPTDRLSRWRFKSAPCWAELSSPLVVHIVATSINLTAPDGIDGLAHLLSHHSFRIGGVKFGDTVPNVLISVSGSCSIEILICTPGG